MTRHAARAALVILALALVILVGPGMHASGALTEVGPLELGAGAAPIGTRTRGAVREDVDGYRVQPRSEAVVVVPLTLPRPYEERTLVRIWAYGPAGVRTTAVLRAADGSERTLGRATTWTGRVFDVTEEARRGAVELRVRGENSTDQPVLFLDRLAPVAATGSIELTASPGGVGLLVGVVTLMVLALAGRLGRHWSLALALAAFAALLWDDVTGTSLKPLEGVDATTWNTATQASWFGFDDGLLSGSWQGISSLGVQIFHALTPVVGTVFVSARVAALLASLAALAAVYALAYRATGRFGAIVAVVLGAAALGLHEAVGAGSTLPVLVLAGALFGYALHAALSEATPVAIGVVGAAAALLVLADPAWLPGALLAVAVVALACSAPGQRLRIARLGLVTMVVCVLPHLVSTAGQNDGRMLANQDVRAVAARNIEFLGDGHGAPTPQQYAADPRSGRPVTLTGYLFTDHSIQQVAGGTLAGGQDGIEAFVGTDRLASFGTVSMILLIAGAAFVLLLARLRMLALLAALVASPTLFIAAQTGGDAAMAGAVLWPVLLACAAILVHAAVELARPSVERRMWRLGRRLQRARLPDAPRAAPAAPQRRRT